MLDLTSMIHGERRALLRYFPTLTPKDIFRMCVCLHLVGSRARTHDLRLDSKLLYLLNHLASPYFILYYFI